MRCVPVVIVALVAAAVIGASVGPSVPMGTDAPAPIMAAPCQTWHVPDTDAAIVKADQLIARGWYGVQWDGAERLYSPACLTR